MLITFPGTPLGEPLLHFTEKAVATHSSTLAWKIPWTEEPGRLQSMGSQSRTRLSNFTFTFHFHALEKEMAIHSSIVAWRIPGMGEPVGLPSMGSHRVGHDWSELTALLYALSYFPSAFFLQPFSSPDLLLSLNKKKTLSPGLELLPMNKVHGALSYSLAEVNFTFLDQVLCWE